MMTIRRSCVRRTIARYALRARDGAAPYAANADAAITLFSARKRFGNSAAVSGLAICAD